MENEIYSGPKKKTLHKYLTTSLVLVAVFALGYYSGHTGLTVSNGKIEITKGNQPATSADYSLLWDALDKLNSEFVDRPLDQKKLMYGAVAGLVSAAGDPYTAFFNPEEAKKFQDQLQGTFEGIGAEIGKKEDQIVIVAPLDDTPAQRAGLLAGDVIIEIEGETTLGMTTDDAVSKIRGKSGTEVRLKVRHKDATDANEIKITRAKIQIKSVKLETKEINGKKIALIKMSQFGDDTKGLLDETIDKINTGNYAGVILDLRNNPGGYLETAVSTISDWIDEDQVALKEIGNDKNEKPYLTSGVPRLKGMKTVILVNGGSASASEIVAGALQDYNVATLVGEKTFGKGSVQELQPLGKDSELKITIAKWYTPKTRGIDKIGLEPDIKVELTTEDAQNDRDPQLDKALSLF